MTGDTPGIIKGWAGYVSKIPKDYMLCDGRTLPSEQYPELFENIGFIYGGNNFDEFKLPNFEGRFAVGYDPSNSKYEMGGHGGEDFVTLDATQMPRHRHAYSDDTNALGKFPEVEAGFPQSYGYINETKSSGSSSGTGTVYNTSHAGGKNGITQAHENRPPFIVIAKLYTLEIVEKLYSAYHKYRLFCAYKSLN